MLFDPFDLRGLPLPSRIVMAPLTRNRATPAHVPNSLMREYYEQRASFGLIITEGTSPSADGRLPPGGRSPTSAALPESIFTDTKGLQPASQPHALTDDEVTAVVAEYAHAATSAIAAGFDGVELHAANGYLIEQFLNANVNTRTDQWGGSIDGRNRFTLEVARAVSAAIGSSRTGIRVSPYGAFNATGAFPDVEARHLALATALGALGLAYLHLVDHSSMGAPAIPEGFRAALRKAFRGVFIASGGFDHEKAEAVLLTGGADLVAFGRLALANPDLSARFELGLALNAPDASTFDTPGAKGYTDYPVADVPGPALVG